MRKAKKSVSKLFLFLFLFSSSIFSLPSSFANEITAFVVIAPYTLIEYSLDGIVYGDSIKTTEYSNDPIFVRVIQASANVSSVNLEINSTQVPLLQEQNYWKGQFMNTYPEGELSIIVVVTQLTNQTTRIPTTLSIGSSRSTFSRFLLWVRSFLNSKTT